MNFIISIRLLIIFRINGNPFNKDKNKMVPFFCSNINKFQTNIMQTFTTTRLQSNYMKCGRILQVVGHESTGYEFLSKTFLHVYYNSMNTQNIT